MCFVRPNAKLERVCSHECLSNAFGCKQEQQLTPTAAPFSNKATAFHGQNANNLPQCCANCSLHNSSPHLPARARVPRHQLLLATVALPVLAGVLGVRRRKRSRVSVVLRCKSTFQVARQREHFRRRTLGFLRCEGWPTLRFPLPWCGGRTGAAFTGLRRFGGTTGPQTCKFLTRCGLPTPSVVLNWPGHLEVGAAVVRAVAVAVRAPRRALRARGPPCCPPGVRSAWCAPL